ncbi:unnamed protein product [Merluccius merluccius]
MQLTSAIWADMAAHENCQLVNSPLKQDICHLKDELRSKDKLILGFSTVASSQAQHVSAVNATSDSYGTAEQQSELPDDNTTMPWFPSNSTCRCPMPQGLSSEPSPDPGPNPHHCPLWLFLLAPVISFQA